MSRKTIEKRNWCLRNWHTKTFRSLSDGKLLLIEGINFKLYRYMFYGYKYKLSPSPAVERELERHIDICRQVYNHFLHELNQSEEFLSRYQLQSMLPDLKDWWTELSSVYSKVLQMVTKRVIDNLNRLSEKKKCGYKVGRLKWKAPHKYRSITYNQVGFKLKNTSGRSELHLSKIGVIPIKLHRPIPQSAKIKQVTIKKESTGKWFATFGIKVDKETPRKPVIPNEVVGIDLGIVNYSYDTDGIAIESVDLSNERERLEREHRKLSRKQYGSKNWEKQRRRVAECYAKVKRKRHDFLHKLSTYYAQEYELVAVEDLDTKSLIELPGSSRNRAGSAWGMFLSMLEYKCEREGTHFVAVDPAGTTIECASCGSRTEKPLWVRDHSCPACGFSTHRDANAAWNILYRGLKSVGVGHAEYTPPETATATDTTVVSASRVIERGSPDLKQELKETSGFG